MASNMKGLPCLCTYYSGILFYQLFHSVDFPFVSLQSHHKRAISSPGRPSPELGLAFVSVVSFSAVPFELTMLALEESGWSFEQKVNPVQPRIFRPTNQRLLNCSSSH